MGRIQKQIDTQKDLIVYTVYGKVTAKQVISEIDKFYQADITGKVLWDLSESDVGSLTDTEIESVALTPRKSVDMRSGGKTAIVAPKELTFGLARMYELQINTLALPFETRTFHSTEDAFQWLFDSA